MTIYAGEQVCWEVQYSDGDSEDLNAQELSEFLPAAANLADAALAPSVQRHAPRRR